ncbi:3-keto-5-aminohexanoate cleavage protein [Novispirillum sp. DQ9]|uniref:3-keto-5-aminohexanoate cleavage protein n=1 Tax=Novispirillum sp. DQ9 TaxID=3398612 RepID=UPI003C7A8C16
MSQPPLIIAVAPNGARRRQADHPALPVTAAETAATAALCADAGASLLHLHVRDRAEAHVLDAEAYREAIAAVRKAVGDRLIVQITTEAVGRYTAAEQMAVVRAVRPEAVSVAVRELIPDAAQEAEAARFLAELAADEVLVQHIVYSAEEVIRLRDLIARGVVPDDRPAFPLFVLGRYSAGQTSDPADLLPFLAAWGDAGPWAMCAFGAREAACCALAASLGGHVRVGFENNLWRPDGGTAAHNAELVAYAAQAGALCGRVPATAEAARDLLRPKPGGPAEASGD